MHIPSYCVIIPLVTYPADRYPKIIPDTFANVCKKYVCICMYL